MLFSRHHTPLAFGVLLEVLGDRFGMVEEAALDKKGLAGNCKTRCFPAAPTYATHIARALAPAG